MSKESKKKVTPVLSPSNVKNEEWTQRIEKNGITECVRVEKLANTGYVVTLSKYGEVKGKYTSVDKKFFSESNPLEEKEDESLTDTLAKELIRK